MIEKNRKAIVSRDGRSIAVLGKDGKEWRLCPASSSFCAWAARDPKKRGVVGFGDTVWMAIRDVAVE